MKVIVNASDGLREQRGNAKIFSAHRESSFDIIRPKFPNKNISCHSGIARTRTPTSRRRFMGVCCLCKF